MRQTFPLASPPGVLLAFVVGALMAALATASCSEGVAFAPVMHPMDTLTAEEHSPVVAVLKKDAYAGGDDLYPLFTLEEPAKDEVLGREPAEPVSRRAFAIVK